MKIYTEVNYIWKDDKLVQTNSKSFDYEGEVAQAHTKKGGPRYARFNIPHNHQIAEATGMTSETADKISDTGEGSLLENIPTINDIKDVVSKGPTGGYPKEWADKIYGGSTKDAVTSIQETYKDFEGGVKSFIEGEIPFQDTTDDETEDGTILTTPEEREAVLKQGKVAEGGRKKTYGRQFMAGDPLSASILAPKL
tara:strand:+ start:743 stop:1330 length:588 start_codon:yes stop_codon:yes gene_type:complete